MEDLLDAHQIAFGGDNLVTGELKPAMKVGVKLEVEEIQVAHSESDPLDTKVKEDNNSEEGKLLNVHQEGPGDADMVLGELNPAIKVEAKLEVEDTPFAHGESDPLDNKVGKRLAIS